MKSKDAIREIKSRVQKFYQKSDCISIFDWVLFLVLAVFCFFSFVHPDIIYTGNRSWMMYRGIGSFYDHVAEWTQDQGANYMPSTFWLFAIWNLPLKLFGCSMPESIWDFRMGYILWYKLLTILFFIGSVILMEKIARKIGLSERKAKVAKYAFMTMPFCFFSQFIFSQTDIFTVFFVLLGTYYFYRNQKNDMWRFSAFFGIAITFKYFAILIYLVLLLIREKKVLSIAKYGIFFSIPFAVEYLIYHGSAGFQNGVFGFRALSFVSASNITNEMSSVSYTKLVSVLIVLWAYFVSTKNKEEEIAWTQYLCCGACFALFGLSTWHPQWLIFMAPFLVLSAFMNCHLEKFLWLEAGLVIVGILLCSVIYKGMVDVNLLQNLAWKEVFHLDGYWYCIADVIPKMDTNTTYSVFVALLLVLFLFKHPKYVTVDKKQEEKTDKMHLIRLRFLLLVIGFSVPAFFAAYKNTIEPRTFLTDEKSLDDWVSMKKGVELTQQLPEVEGSLSRIGFYAMSEGDRSSLSLTMEIREENGKSVYRHVFAPEEIMEGYYTDYVIEDAVLTDEKQNYTIAFYSTNGTEGECFKIGLVEKKKEDLLTTCQMNGEKTEFTCRMYYMARR